MDKETALQRCMKLCSTREYAPAEIAEKMSNWGVLEPHIAWVTEKLQQERFLDEYRFARYYTNDKIKFNRWGRIKVRLMLKHKGVSEAAITEALNGFPEADYRQILEDELKKKRKSIKDADSYTIRGKLFQFASARGFETDSIMKGIDRML